MVTVTISKKEYARLKRLDEHFNDLLSYFERLVDIRTARDEVRRGKTISQEKLFKKLGF